MEGRRLAHPASAKYISQALSLTNWGGPLLAALRKGRVSAPSHLLRPIPRLHSRHAQKAQVRTVGMHHPIPHPCDPLDFDSPSTDLFSSQPSVTAITDSNPTLQDNRDLNWGREEVCPSVRRPSKLPQSHFQCSWRS